MLQGAFGVTIARNASGSGVIYAAIAVARQLCAVYVERPHNLSIEELRRQNNLAALIVLESSGPRIHSEAGSFAYHPGMALLRLQQLKNGAQDHLAEALALREGSRVLDCTLGLGADAAIASYIVGAAGQVVGVEASPLLHFAVSWGLAHYVTPDADLNAALRRIRTVHALAQDFLERCAPDSFDAVYFDAMFRHPVPGSNGMEALRPLAYTQPLAKTAVILALRAAPRVIIKERSEYLLRGYGCTEFTGGRYSRVKYGVLRREK